MRTKVHVATSRDIGERCKPLVEQMGYELVDMETCDVFVSVLYDQLIKADYINSRPCFNFHPGILPWYRGAGAYSWAIINGELETGVTLHKIDKDIDHGDVIEIQRFMIQDTDTAGDLFAKAEDTIFRMFQEWLPKLVRGEYKALRQKGGHIYLRRDLEAAKDLTRYARAFHFPGKEQAYYCDTAGKKTYLCYEPL